METDLFIISNTTEPFSDYSILEVTKKVIREKYYPRNTDVAETLINGNDKTAFNRLVDKLLELNGFPDGAEYIPNGRQMIYVPILKEFQEFMVTLTLNDSEAVLETENSEEKKKNVTIISAGHGMDRPGSETGAVDANGIKEITYIYWFTKRLYPEMERINLNYINLKQVMENALKEHNARNKIDKSNEIFTAQGNVTLHFAIHADSNTKGYEGITLFYIDGAEISKKIADFFAQKLTQDGFETRVRSDKQTKEKRLGELHDTDAPAAYMEIGSIDTKSSRAALINRLDNLAISLAEAINAFNIERPNR